MKTTQTTKTTEPFRMVSKFSDAEGAKLVVLCKQLTSGEYETSVKLTKANEKRSLTGMRSTFPTSQKDKATGRFAELVADAEKAKWVKEQSKAKKSTGFDAIPAAVVGGRK